MNDNELHPAYIARDETGVAVGAVVDLANAVTAEGVAEFIRDGLAIERVTVGWARKHLFTDAPFDPQKPAG